MELSPCNCRWGEWFPEKKEHLNPSGEYTGLASGKWVWQSISVRGSDKVTKTDVVQLVPSRRGVVAGTRDTKSQEKQQKHVSSSSSHALCTLKMSERCVSDQKPMTCQHPPVKSYSGRFVSAGTFCLHRSSCSYKMESKTVSSTC